MTESNQLINELLASRFADAPTVQADANPTWQSMAARASCRRFRSEAVPANLLDTLCALALASPTKSDLQQRDIVIVEDPALRTQITSRIPGGNWIAKAPALLVFCGNNRRHRQIIGWRNQEFINDHLDSFFNASVDAGIALSAFVTAAESSGLGVCPISAIRNESEFVSELLQLPDHVFPVAGLAVGWPSETAQVSVRLPLAATVHRNRFDDSRSQQMIAEYDSHRASVQPYDSQRFVERFGNSDSYGWSEDKARQYSVPERVDFGSFIRNKGFKLD